MSATPVYLSNSRFNLLRSYVPGIVVRDTGAHSLSFAGGVVSWVVGVYAITAKLKSNVEEWTSNYYTLDYVWDFPAFTLTISGVPFSPFGVFVFSDFNPPYFGVWLSLSLFTPGVEHHKLVLPGAPAGYWLPPDPPS